MPLTTHIDAAIIKWLKTNPTIYARITKNMIVYFAIAKVMVSVSNKDKPYKYTHCMKLLVCVRANLHNFKPLTAFKAFIDTTHAYNLA